jgi:predicted GNAT superfamily acetyltransferase
MESMLYGNVPTDRFTASWDLDSRRTIDRLHRVWQHSYRSPSLEEVAAIPVATVETAGTLAAASAKMVRVEIPGDIDELKRVDPERAVAWQRELREIFPCLLTTKRAIGLAPDEVKVDSTKGAYEVNGFVTGLDERDRRRSYYLLERLNDR